jgi:phospholipid/cholesterol/gamma-HCH transport system substrate-binding protein
MNVERRERAVQFRVGIFVLVGLGLFLGMVYVLGARAALFESRYTIHADFTEVGGLTEGATVRLAGVQIGRVTGVNLPPAPGGKVRVDMTIARRYGDRIRKNSVARIETQGLLGDRIVEITVGSADAAPVRPEEVIAARDPTDIGAIMGQGAETVQNVAALAESLREVAQSLNESKLVDDTAATMASARKITEQFARDSSVVMSDAKKITGQVSRLVDQVEKGDNWVHALLYDEPKALRELNGMIASMKPVLDRIERGEGAVGVLTSAESTMAAKRFVAAVDRFGQMAEKPDDREGLLPGLVFDPRYKSVLDDLRVVTHNLREVSDRIAGGKGTLGSLVKDEPDEGGIRQASRDFQAAVANLKEITEKINDGEGTVGALIADPTIYERLVNILDGAQRSFLLRGLLKGLGSSDGKSDRKRDDAVKSDRKRDDRAPAEPRKDTTTERRE